MTFSYLKLLFCNFIFLFNKIKYEKNIFFSLSFIL